MEAQAKFEKLLPGRFYMQHDIPALSAYLQQNNWLSEGETITHLEKPGEGNMNFVLRVITPERSFILKQSRPWVEKYPTIDAPVERIAVEAKYFQSINGIPGLSPYSPKVKFFDSDNGILCFEDLGKGADFMSLYQEGNHLNEETGLKLMDYLSALHAIEPPADFPENISMRQLNAEHIFNYPYLEDNGFDLDTIQPGLQALAMTYKQDQELKSHITEVSKSYLGHGTSLLHGDYYPGSWLQVEDRIRVIDPEFGFVGPKEFDLAVFFAHMIMAEQADSALFTWWQKYEPRGKFDQKLFASFCGIEIMRRVIGLAQLPLKPDLAYKKDLLKTAREFILSGKLPVFKS